MFEIQVPASTTNLGSAFDIAGMAINLFNVFQFEKALKTTFSGFLPKYRDEDNLVYRAYQYVFKKVSRDIISVHISLVRSEIPIARGLGSSSSCVIAGVFAANIMLGQPFSKDECHYICSEIEGHPDNVAASIYGGLTTTVLLENRYYISKVKPSASLRIFMLIPPFEVSTSDARKVLKESYSLSEIVYSSARAVHLKESFITGNLDLIREMIKDKIHVPCRAKLISEYSHIMRECESRGYALTISGSGSSLLCVTNRSEEFSNINHLEVLKGWHVQAVEVDQIGIRIREVQL